MNLSFGIPSNITGLKWFLVFFINWCWVWIKMIPVFLIVGTGIGIVLYPFVKIAENGMGLNKK